MIIDLRSDTVTKPTKEMLEFMFNAEVGDDVFQEDPSISRLEEKAADMFDMDDALFCPSGTMTNQIGIKVLTQTPGELICDELSHIYQYEGGGIAFNSGLSVRLLKGDRGRINAESVENAINPDDIHKPTTQLVSVENTSNRGGGSIYDLKDLQEIGAVCKKHNLNYHLDGARVFNAIVESDYGPPDLGKLFDTISVCLSKGLGCPVGSLLLGSAEIIRQARRIRKVMGGGMRQAGYLAAAGIFALDHHVERLRKDHEKARTLESALKHMPFVGDILPVQTNIVVFGLDGAVDNKSFVEILKEKGILAVPFGEDQIRFTCHLDFTNEQLEKLLEILKSL